MANELVIARVQEHEVDLVLDLLAQGSAYAQAQGIEQWPARFAVDFVSGGVERGEVWLARLDRGAVATCTLIWSDPLFWGADDKRAGYLHRLAVADAARGAGIGHRLLDWAQNEVAAAGRPALRLDCLAENRRLRDWYAAAGFDHRGDRQVTRPPGEAAHSLVEVSLYERTQSDESVFCH